jgi:hypothetical protein
MFVLRGLGRLAFAAILALFCIVRPTFAQVPVQLAPTPHLQFTDSTGKLLSGGFLYTYSSGTTSRLDTYTDSSGVIVNAWPIPLDSSGSPSNGSTQTGIWITSAAIKFCAYTSALVQVWCVDGIQPTPFLAGNNNWTGLNTFSGVTTFNAAVVLSAGGTFSGAIGGSPTFTGPVVFSGNPLFTGSPNFTSATPLWMTAAQANLNPEIQSVVIANSASGTTVNSLAKLTGAPSTAVTTLVTDTVGAVGIVIAGAGTTGSATIQNVGIAPCNFDAATTAGDYVVFSATVAGDCHDVPGGGFPSSGQAVGRVLSTNGSAGLYQLNLFATEDRSTTSSATFPTVVYNVASGSTNANIGATTMVTVGASNATYRFVFYISETVVGASCTGNTTLTVNTIWQDPLDAGARTNTAAYNLAINNGTVGEAFHFSGVAGGNQSPNATSGGLIRAKTGTVIQYSTTYAIGTGCSPGPQYQLFPILEQLTSN